MRRLLYAIFVLITFLTISCNRSNKYDKLNVLDLILDKTEFKLLYTFKDHSVKNNYYVRLVEEWEEELDLSLLRDKGKYGEIVITDKQDKIIDIIELVTDYGSNMRLQKDNLEFSSYSYLTGEGDEFEIGDGNSNMYNLIIADLNYDGLDDLVFSRSFRENIYYIQNNKGNFLLNDTLSESLYQMPLINTALKTVENIIYHNFGSHQIVYQWDSKTKDFKLVLNEFKKNEDYASDYAFYDDNYSNARFKYFDLIFKDTRVELIDNGNGYPFLRNISEDGSFTYRSFSIEPRGIKDIKVEYSSNGIFVLSTESGRLLLEDWKKIESKSIELIKNNEGYYTIPELRGEDYITEGINLTKDTFYNQIFKTYGKGYENMIFEHMKMYSTRNFYDFLWQKDFVIRITGSKVLNGEIIDLYIRGENIL